MEVLKKLIFFDLLFLALTKMASDKSTELTLQPIFLNISVNLPAPLPTSKTFLPFRFFSFHLVFSKAY